jgi:hypothetical protein
MNLHLLAGIPVLLTLVAASAYREALRNEPIRRVPPQLGQAAAAPRERRSAFVKV